jgi:hypothetical protein
VGIRTGEERRGQERTGEERRGEERETWEGIIENQKLK